jgi:hypothetical protein
MRISTSIQGASPPLLVSMQCSSGLGAVSIVRSARLVPRPFVLARPLQVPRSRARPSRAHPPWPAGLGASRAEFRLSPSARATSPAIEPGLEETNSITRVLMSPRDERARGNACRSLPRRRPPPGRVGAAGIAFSASRARWRSLASRASGRNSSRRASTSWRIASTKSGMTRTLVRRVSIPRNRGGIEA